MMMFDKMSREEARELYQRIKGDTGIDKTLAKQALADLRFFTNHFTTDYGDKPTQDSRKLGLAEIIEEFMFDNGEYLKDDRIPVWISDTREETVSKILDSINNDIESLKMYFEDKVQNGSKKEADGAEDILYRLKEFEEVKNESLKEDIGDKAHIKVEVIVSNELGEKVVSGKVEDKYDEQTLEDWYDFASNVEGIVDRKFIVTNISLSENPESLSEYIDFYRKDEGGNKKEGLVDLRLSDHASTTNARQVRKNKASRLDPNYRLISVIVNERRFDSYEKALQYIETLLEQLNETLKEHISGKMSVEDIAKKHNVPVKDIEKQVKIGIKVEKEHTDDEKKAERIALDHLFEIPDYYDRLTKMEKGALKEDKNKKIRLYVNKEYIATSNNYPTVQAFIDKVREDGFITYQGLKDDGTLGTIKKEIKPEDKLIGRIVNESIKEACFNMTYIDSFIDEMENKFVDKILGYLHEDGYTAEDSDDDIIDYVNGCIKDFSDEDFEDILTLDEF